MLKKILAATMLVSFVGAPILSVKANPASTETSNVRQMNSTPTSVKVNHYHVLNDTVKFDSDWMFHLGDVVGAHSPVYDDTRWQAISLPHDYSLTQEYTQRGEAESGYKLGGIGWYRKNFIADEAMANQKIYLHFDGAYMLAEVYVNGQKLAFHPYGYTPFSVDITDAVRFGGNNTIAIKTNNPVPTSRWYSGSGLYRSVYLKATPKAHFNEYGIKMTTPSLEAQKDSTEGVDVVVSGTVKNSDVTAKTLKMKVALLNKDNQSVVAQSAFTEASLVQPQLTQTFNTTFKVVQPKLWSVDAPHLYILRTELYNNDEKIQTVDQETGFRFIRFERETGFKLNGQPLKLKGVSMHHDQGSLGAKAYYDAIDRQFDILKEMGVNSVRVTHNPSTRSMKDIANRKGMLLIEELFDTWTFNKNSNTNDYGDWFEQAIQTPMKLVGVSSGEMTWGEFDAKQTVLAGLNDPSIIMWSTGNEVMESINGNPQRYPQVIETIIRWIEQVDTTRPTTIGDNKIKGNNAISIAMADKLSNKTGLKGIVGLNYADGTKYDEAYNRHSNWVIYGSETASSVNSRGVYNVKGNESTSNRHRSAYDQSAVSWGHPASQAWHDVITRDFVAGEYVWTGFDYLGEPTPWNKTDAGSMGVWPAPKSSYFGIIDTAGFPKDSYYFYQSQWNDKVNTLHVLPAWKESMVKKTGDNVEVVVYSDAKKVKLEFVAPDGQVTNLGEKTFDEVQTTAGYKYQIYQGSDKSATAHQNLYLTWNVPYRDGTVRATAYNAAGEEIRETKGRKEIKTFKPASQLALQANKHYVKAHDQSLVYVTVDVQDEDGNIVEDANQRIEMNVTGPATLVAMDNGDPTDHQSYLENNRKAFNGKALAIVKMTGDSGLVSVTATANGLTQGTTVIEVNGTNQPSTEKRIDRYDISKLIYLNKGTPLQLPQTIKAYFTDNTTENLAVNWNLTEELTTKMNNGETVIVSGTLGNTNIQVDVTVVVLDQVAAIKNISLAVETNTTLNLPENVEAFLPNGEKMDSLFPVVWENVASELLTRQGTFTVNGQAKVLGATYPVVANVRVANKERRLQHNVAPTAARLTEDTPANLVSDTLSAIKDNSTSVNANTGGGANPSLWSNYELAQTGVKQSNLTFGFDTAQNIGQVVVYTNRDSWSARHPKSIEFKYRASAGEEPTLVQATVVGTPENIGNVRKTVYRLSQNIPAVDFILAVTNSDEVTGKVKDGQTVHACSAIVEVQLMTAIDVFDVSSTANLSSLAINGKDVPSQVLNTGEINTPSEIAEITVPQNPQNVAVTVLPAYEGIVKVYTESEDHTNHRVYQVHLESEVARNADNSMDDVVQPTVTAGSTENRASEAIGNAVDNVETTLWHSVWGGTDLANLWFKFTLAESTLVDGIRYLPRQTGGDNGKVSAYEVYVSDDDQNYRKVTEGNWTNDLSWKLASFAPVQAKYVKLQAVRTFGNPADRFMSAAEIRLRKAVVQTTLTQSHVTLTPNTFTHTGEAITPLPVVQVENVALRKGIDYKLRYENNVDVTNNATVTVVGIGDYKGEVVLPFAITSAVTIDKEGLATFVSEIEALLPTLWEATVLKDTIKEAKAILQKPNPTNEEVEQMKATLENLLANAKKVKTFTFEESEKVVVSTASTPEIANHILKVNKKQSIPVLDALGKQYDLLDIHFTNTSNVYQPFNSKAEVKVKIVQPLHKVFFVENETLTELPATTVEENGVQYAKFNVEHFSDYAIVYTTNKDVVTPEKPEEPKPPVKPGDTQVTPEKPPVVTPEKPPVVTPEKPPVVKPQKPTTPQKDNVTQPVDTGDYSYLYVLLAVVSIMCVMIIKKRKN